jgi:glyoxylase-like metal-dependent hydrolase (beta-lactamase superfamily II)
MKSCLLCAVMLFSQHLWAQSAEPIAPDWCGQLPRPEYQRLERLKTPDEWFQVYRIRPGVFAIYEPHQFEEVISYLIVGQNRSLLFDTGLGVGRINDVVKQLTSLPVIVVNSHTHFDHVGGNAEFREIWNRNLPYTKRNARGGSNDYSQDALTPQRVCGQLPPGVKPGALITRPWTSTHTLNDGEVIHLGGRDLEVIFTPGHTPDSLCLLDRKNGLLFTGDTYYPGPIYLFVAETDVSAYTASVARLARLAPDLNLLLPAHNLPTASPEALLKLNGALTAIRAGKAKPVISDGHREYKFDGFSILTADKP